MRQVRVVRVVQRVRVLHVRLRQARVQRCVVQRRRRAVTRGPLRAARARRRLLAVRRRLLPRRLFLHLNGQRC